MRNKTKKLLNTKNFFLLPSTDIKSLAIFKISLLFVNMQEHDIV